MTAFAGVELFVQAFTKPIGDIRKFVDISLGALTSPGVLPGTGVTLAQNPNPPQHFQFTVSATVACVDATTSGSQGTLQLGTFPEGNILFLGAVVNLAIARVGTAIAAGAAVIASIGTVVPAVDTTLTSTEANMVASTACTLTAGAGSFLAVGVAPAVLDGTAGAKTINLNFVVPDADSSGNDSLTVTGTVDLTFLWLGDK